MLSQAMLLAFVATLVLGLAAADSRAAGRQLLQTSCASTQATAESVFGCINLLRTNPDVFTSAINDRAAKGKCWKYEDYRTGMLSPARQPFNLHTSLVKTAQQHNDLMAEHRALKTQLPGEPDLLARVTKSGYGSGAMAEMVSYMEGPSISALDVILSFLCRGDPTKSQIMTCFFEDIGVASDVNATSKYSKSAFTTLDFACKESPSKCSSCTAVTVTPAAPKPAPAPTPAPVPAPAPKASPPPKSSPPPPVVKPSPPPPKSSPPPPVVKPSPPPPVVKPSPPPPTSSPPPPVDVTPSVPAVSPAPSPVPSPTSADNYVNLVVNTGPNSRECLAVNPASGALELVHCNKEDSAQKFTLVAAAEGYYSIVSSVTSGCLQPKQGETSEGASLCTGACSGMDYQMFRFEVALDGRYQITIKAECATPNEESSNTQITTFERTEALCLETSPSAVADVYLGVYNKNPVATTTQRFEIVGEGFEVFGCADCCA